MNGAFKAAYETSREAFRERLSPLAAFMEKELIEALSCRLAEDIAEGVASSVPTSEEAKRKALDSARERGEAAYIAARYTAGRFILRKAAEPRATQEARDRAEAFKKWTRNEKQRR